MICMLRERLECGRARGTCFCAFGQVEWAQGSASDASERLWWLHARARTAEVAPVSEL